MMFNRSLTTAACPDDLFTYHNGGDNINCSKGCTQDYIIKGANIVIYLTILGLLRHEIIRRYDMQNNNDAKKRFICSATIGAGITVGLTLLVYELLHKGVKYNVEYESSRNHNCVSTVENYNECVNDEANCLARLLSPVFGYLLFIISIPATHAICLQLLEYYKNSIERQSNNSTLSIGRYNYFEEQESKNKKSSNDSLNALEENDTGETASLIKDAVYNASVQ